MASRFSLMLPLALISINAFAIGELPTVNSARVVSVRDLYGVPPEEPVFVSPISKNSNGLLIPNKPTEDLWTNKTDDAPLRMPEKSEITVLKSNFSLPEESLRDSKYFASNSEPDDNDVIPILKEVPKPIYNEFNDSNVLKDLPTPVPSTIRSVPKFVVPEPRIESSFEDTQKEIQDDNRFAADLERPLTKLSPTELKLAFKKTFTTKNKHLSTYRIDDGFDEASIEETNDGFDSSKSLSEKSGGVRPLEIKITFNDDDSALSRDNYNLLTEYSGIVATSPKRAVQISISERTTRSYDGRKLAARRLAIIEQVLKDSGILDKRIIPVLSQRNDDSFVLRVISNDTFETLSEKKRDMFGDTVSSKTYKSMSW